MAPAKTPPEIIEKVNAEMAHILATPDMKEKLQTQGTEPLRGRYPSKKDARCRPASTPRLAAALAGR
jgi:hypothetical protein